MGGCWGIVIVVRFIRRDNVEESGRLGIMNIQDSLYLVDRVLYAVDTTDTYLADACLQWMRGGLWVRWLVGWRMSTVEELWGEFSAAMQFPYYCGKNWAAFSECLSELDLNGSLGPRTVAETVINAGIVAVIFNAGSLLLSDMIELRTFVRTLQHTQDVYAIPIDRGEWDRPAVPFHVVLQLDRDKAVRWEDAGASLSWFDLSGRVEWSLHHD